MLELFNYEFMRTAFICGVLIALIIPLVGIVVVLRHLAMIGDSLSHVSLSGVAAGLIMSLNPVAGAVVAALAGAFSIEAIRRRIPAYSEVAIAIVTSAGVGIAGIMSGYIKNSQNFDSFLFGSIVAITPFEKWLIVGIAVMVILFFALFWREFRLLSFDEGLARLAGVPVGFMNALLTIMVAVTVAVASRAVGALIVSGIMIIPVVNALILGKGYAKTTCYAIIFAVIAMVTALIMSFYVPNLKPGGTIVMVAIAELIVTYVLRVIFIRVRFRSRFDEQERISKQLDILR